MRGTIDRVRQIDPIGEIRHFYWMWMHASEAERDTALTMIERTRKPGHRVTSAGDKLFDAASFIIALRERKVTPHLARAQAAFTFRMIAYNLVRLPKIIGIAA
ncbi:MAG TPA: hypothetical protein VF286_00760 [Acidiphilium sp.]